MNNGRLLSQVFLCQLTLRSLLTNLHSKKGNNAGEEYLRYDDGEFSKIRTTIRRQ